MNKKITLVVYNEDYWNNTLIYTQNITPLLKLAEMDENIIINQISFVSIFRYIVDRKAISARHELYREKGIKDSVCPILFYPTRYMVVNVFWLPFFILTMLPYLSYFSIRDLLAREGNLSIYSLRSYQSSLAFYLLYFGRSKRVMDTRTDWIEEVLTAGYWKRGSLTDKMWRYFEKRIMKSFDKTLFISEEQRDDAIKRNNLEYDEKKYIVFYNQVDYALFSLNEKGNDTNNFLYTGSFGRWNKIELYLDFYVSICSSFPKSFLLIATSTPKTVIERALSSEKYDRIRDRVKVFYNVERKKLPKIYSQCKYGLQIMNRSDNRIGVKYVEYVAAGLIPIVHENVRGAAVVAKKYGLGVVVGDDISSTDITNIEQARINKVDWDRFRTLTDYGKSYVELSKIFFE